MAERNPPHSRHIIIQDRSYDRPGIAVFRWETSGRGRPAKLVEVTDGNAKSRAQRRTIVN